MPPGIQFGIYRTASREDADVLCLSSEEATDVLSLGPSDGKAVFNRHWGERWCISAGEVLTHIERYRGADVQVQDPSVSTDEELLQLRSPTDITAKLRSLLDDKMTVGYGEYQTSRVNLLSMPKMWPGELHCLPKTEYTQIYDRLRCMNHTPGLPACESALGTILSAHLAASLVLVDGNRHRTAVKNMFGYKMWLLWPGLVEEGRAEFHSKGNEFHGRGSRYILIAPEDECIQTPGVSQDTHSVVVELYAVSTIVSLLTSRGVVGSQQRATRCTGKLRHAFITPRPTYELPPLAAGWHPPAANCQRYRFSAEVMIEVQHCLLA